MGLTSAQVASYRTRLTNLPKGAWGADRYPVAPGLLPVALYVRVSDPLQARADRFSLSEQIERTNAEAGRLGWGVALVCWDVRPAPVATRKGFRAMLDALTAHEIDGLVVWHGDRVSRGFMPTALYWETLQARDDIPDEHIRYLEGIPFQRRLMAVTLMIAHQERESLRARTRMGREGSARVGKMPPGTPPYGIRRGPEGYAERDPDMWPVLERVAERLRAGLSYHKIARELNDAGIPPAGARPGAKRERPRGWQWSGAALHKIMHSPAIYGEWPYTVRQEEGQSPHTFTVPVPALLSREEAERLLAGRAQERGGRPYKVPGPLAGLVRCGVCGYKMSNMTKTRGHRYRRRQDGTVHKWPRGAPTVRRVFRCQMRLLRIREGAEPPGRCRVPQDLPEEALWQVVWDALTDDLTVAARLEEAVTRETADLAASLPNLEAEAGAIDRELAALLREEMAYARQQAREEISAEAFAALMLDVRTRRKQALSEQDRVRQAIASMEASRPLTVPPAELAAHFAALLPSLDRAAQEQFVRDVVHEIVLDGGGLVRVRLAVAGLEGSYQPLHETSA